MPDDAQPEDARPADAGTPDSLVRAAAAPVDDAEEPAGDAAASSPGAWTALAAPGKPDGEVDTRA